MSNEEQLLKMGGSIGIICAGDSEIAPFLPLIKKSMISEKAMLQFYKGVIEEISIVALFCGVCKTNAAIATQILIDSYGCNAIINAGTSGGMDKTINLLDTVISTESAYWDVGQDILTDFHPWMDGIYFKADEHLLELARKALLKMSVSEKVHFGRMITGESFIEDRYRDEINANFSPLCVDMETASIAHVCYVNKIPYIAIRTVTDTAEHIGVEEFELNCDKASEISASIVISMLKELYTERILAAAESKKTKSKDSEL